jgi:hypothetical protein
MKWENQLPQYHLDEHLSFPKLQNFLQMFVYREEAFEWWKCPYQRLFQRHRSFCILVWASAEGKTPPGQKKQTA